MKNSEKVNVQSKENHPVIHTCIYCLQHDYEEKYPTKGIFDTSYMICQCRACKAFFLAPAPDAEEIARAYDVDYYGRKSEKFIRFVENLVDVFRTYRSYELSRYIPNHSKVLDIGCGNGRSLLLLKKFGDFELHGTELPGKSASRAKQIDEIRLKLGNIDFDEYPENYFDAVTMYQVFEHLDKPHKTLDVIDRIIKPGGVLILSFPNIKSFQSRLFKGRWFHLDPPRHLFLFKPDDFSELMKNRNYVELKRKYFSAEQNSFGWIQSILNCFYSKRELLYERLKGNKEYGKEYSKANIFLQQLFFVISFPLFLIFDLIESFFRDGATVKFIYRKK